jgi:hypothetical protein
VRLFGEQHDLLDLLGPVGLLGREPGGVGDRDAFDLDRLPVQLDLLLRRRLLDVRAQLDPAGLPAQQDKRGNA